MNYLLLFIELAAIENRCQRKVTTIESNRIEAYRAMPRDLANFEEEEDDNDDRTK